MKPSMISLSVLISALAPSVAFADCPLNSKHPKFNCTSYEIGLPLNITNSVGGASLTVMDGNVGIGIQSPVAMLDVQSEGVNANESQLILRNPNTGANSAVTTDSYSAGEWRGSQYFIKNGSGTIYGVSTADSSGTPNERMRITEEGKIGIKTSTPGSELHVNGTIRAEEICDQTGNNCTTISNGWGGGGSGSVTSITAGAGLTGGTITSSGTIAVDTGTTANKIVQLDSNGALPAVNGANLTNISAEKISGHSVQASSASNGNFLSFDGTNWINKNISTYDVVGLQLALSNKIDAASLPPSCYANQTLTYISPTGMWACTYIAITPEVFGTQGAGMVLAAPAGGNGTPSFRKLTLADLPSDIGGGGGGGGSRWDEDVDGNISRPTGSVTIGNSSPSGKFSVWYSPASPLNNDEVTTTYSRIRINNGADYLDGNLISMVGVASTGSNQSGEINWIQGIKAEVGVGGNGEVQNAFALTANVRNTLGATIYQARGISVSEPVNSGSGNIFQYAGVYIEAPTVAQNNYSIYSEGGINHFGGPLHATEICDENGQNCHDLSQGWGPTSQKMEQSLTLKIEALKKENADMRQQLKDLATQVKILAAKDAVQKNKKIASAR